MPVSKKEKEILRSLAEQYMNIADLPVHREKVELWRALNRGKMQRPMVCIDQMPWNELNVDGELACCIRDPFWRNVERSIRQTIYMWRHCPVDMVVEPYITIPKCIGNSGYGINPESEKLELNKGTTAVAQHFNRILKDFDDIEKIKDMRITVDHASDRIHMDEGKEIFEGVAPVVQGHGLQFHLGVWDFLTMLIGVEDVYYEIIDRPEFIHACMERITQSVIAGIEQVNALEVYDDISKTCHCSYVYTDELLPGFAQGKALMTKNSWAFGMAQVFTSVSPQVTEEFELPYISRMAEYFGVLYYGCCERLDDRLEIIKRIPNVRKISCSPWSDRKNFAEKVGGSIIMSNKPSPAFLASDNVDWNEVRADLQYTADLAKANSINLEFILKDISTVRFRPERLEKWAQIAMEVVERC